MDIKKIDGLGETAEVQRVSVQPMPTPPQAGSTWAQLRARLDKVTAHDWRSVAHCTTSSKRCVSGWG
jgi:hypothetical protein